MRFIHKIFANIFGYFWLPCPLCGKEFGGHQVYMDEQWDYPVLIDYGATPGYRPQKIKKVICPECAKKIRKGKNYE